jgi:O-antigen ligase
MQTTLPTPPREPPIPWQRIRGRLWPHGLLLGALAGLCGAGISGFLEELPVQLGLLALTLLWVFALDDDVFMAAALILVHIVFDWYQLITMPKGFPWISLLLALLLTARVGWRERQQLQQWVFSARTDLVLWGLLLGLGALAIPRSLNVKDAVIYWLNVLATAVVFWVLGRLVVADLAQLRALLGWLSLLATLIALHTVLEGLTGVILLSTPHLRSYLAANGQFILDVGGAKRAGSLLLNPDSDGAYLACMAFLPAGLLVTAPGRWGKVLHGAQIAVILVALLYTYSTAAWLATAVGAVLFVLLAGRMRVRLAFAGAAVLLIAGALVVFRHLISLLLKHATGPQNLTLRRGAWQTALRIIAAHPLTGIGLGIGQPYITRDAPYRSSMEFIPVDHPHNVFLELAALAGLPVLVVFVGLLARVFVAAFRLYWAAAWAERPLLAGVLASLGALTIHGLADSTWTLPALVPLVWLLAGAISSPRLAVDVRRQAAVGEGEGAPQPVPAGRGWLLWSGQMPVLRDNSATGTARHRTWVIEADNPTPVKPPKE